MIRLCFRNSILSKSCSAYEVLAVVVELSGVADPVSVQQNWEQAKMVSIFECLERMIF